jgi:hypothetical protein
MSHIRRSAFLQILKVAFRFELRMTPIRATPARRSKPVIPSLIASTLFVRRHSLPADSANTSTTNSSAMPPGAHVLV